MASILLVKKLSEHSEYKYQYRVFMRDTTGKRKTKMIEVDSKRQAQKMADILEEKFRETGRIDGLILSHSEKTNMTVDELGIRFLEEVASTRKDKTYQNYKNHIHNNVVPYFSGTKVCALDLMVINRFRDFLRTPEARVNKTKKVPYKETTVKDILMALKCMLGTARAWDIIDKNPMDDFKMPDPNRAERTWYTKEELAGMVEKLYKYVDTQMQYLDAKEETGRFNETTIIKERIDIMKYKVIITLAVVTAARRGELMAIHRKDIDFDKKSMHITKEVLYTPTKKVYMTDSTKTDKDRVVGINDTLIAILKDYYKLIDTLFECEGMQESKTDMLFFSLRNTKNTTFGGLLSPDHMSEWFKKFIEKNDCRSITFHQIRHSSLSHLLEMGVNITEVAKIAGHSVQTLLKTYTHVDTELVVSKAAVYDAMFEAIATQKNLNN